MFYYLEGKLVHAEPYLAVIDCGGVGYACKTTSYTLSKLQVGKVYKLYTYLHVAEEIFDLYGFSSQSELASFKQLIGVSGVGPKAALSILSIGSPESLAMAVITGDEKALTAAPGVGKKIAQRIILELKDKISKEQEVFSSGAAGAVNMPLTSGKLSEASAALAVLGYSQSDINLALKGVDIENLPIEEIVRTALKRMVK
ncbi:MAG: Holliday junction branch migration protein RuvA [Oscillospiraceae bacterium]|nr:Holliday junction branch migration protein RuvA [Oscillospiraceae bacterium]